MFREVQGMQPCEAGAGAVLLLGVRMHAGFQAFACLQVCQALLRLCV